MLVLIEVRIANQKVFLYANQTTGICANVLNHNLFLENSITDGLVILINITVKYIIIRYIITNTYPDSKVHRANMGPPGFCRPQVGPK